MFNEHRIWERAQSGEFSFYIKESRKAAPLIDQHGNECWWTDLLFVNDPNFPEGDHRHNVVREANRHRTDTDVIGGSGKWDPGKAYIQINGKIYGKFRTRGGREPHCALCEGGDMISLEKRFHNSIYRPSGTPPEALK